MSAGLSLRTLAFKGAPMMARLVLSQTTFSLTAPIELLALRAPRDPPRDKILYSGSILNHGLAIALHEEGD
jgi:hypothetical protein